MDIKDEDFQKEVLENEKIVLVDFWAPWCMPCQMLKPTIEDLATEYEEKVDVKMMNVDENPDTSEEYGIKGIPAVLFFKKGEVVKEITGMQSKEVYEKAIEELTG